jgi:hypothetical protein
MANHPWLDDVRNQLAKHALPPAYIRRFMDELSDHFQDITEENMSTEANVNSRLGEPQLVANSAVTVYRRRSFLGRHPTAAFVVFALSPIVSLIVIEAIAIFLFISAVYLIGEDKTFDFTRKIGLIGQSLVPYILAFLTVVIPSVFLSILYCKLAKRLCIRKRWMLMSCVSIATVAMLLCWSATFSDTPGKNCLQCGIWIPAWSGWTPPLRNLGQCLLPLAIGCWFIRRKCDNNQLPLASSGC